MSGRDFYLVQRLTREDAPGRAGFDGLFSCDYMGSSEFEWGALPESLKRIRGGTVVIHEGVVTRNGITVPVFVVGAESVAPTIPDRLTEWMTERYPRGKERSHFPEQVDGTADKYHQRTNAWWALSEDVMWALDRDIAEALLKGATP